MSDVNKHKVERLGAKVLFYYQESEDGDRYGRRTIALLVLPDKKSIFKGKAICSLKDNFRKKTGRDIALGRAIGNFENKITEELNEFENSLISKI